jgi:WD40 repeat protein
MAPNESSLATVGIDINLWDMKSDEPQRTVGPRAASAHVIAAFGPGGTPAAVPDKTPRMHVVPKEYKAIAFSPDSETLAAADRNGIIIRDISIGDPKRAAQKRGGGWYAPEVARLAFSVDGKGLLVAKDKTVGDPVGVQHHDSRGNLLPARKDEPPTLTLWDVATRKALWSRPLPGRVEAISGDGSKAATWDRDVGITLWNAETGTPEDTCREAAEGSSRWGHHWVALSWDGKWVAFPDPQRRTDVLVRKLRGKP